MRREFLCNAHRQQLQQDPVATLNLWITAMQSGQKHYNQHYFAEAVPVLGSAYEAAEILLEQQVLGSTLSANHITSAAVLLAKALKEDNQPNASRIILQSARNSIHKYMGENIDDQSFSDFGSLCLVTLNTCYKQMFTEASKTKSCPLKKHEALSLVSDKAANSRLH